MKYIFLGKTGLSVSRICLGTMTLSDPRTAEQVVRKAIDLGINFFDTANVYHDGKCEENLGRATKEYRDDVIICTKVFFPVAKKPLSQGLNRHHVMVELKKSLERLQTSYVDLYLAHRLDPTVSFENILRTMNGAIQQGRVQHTGASTMFAWEFTKSLWIADKLGLEPFQVMENHYNLLYREEEREMMPLCEDQNIGIMCWGPLARGALTGAYTQSKKPDTQRAQWDTLLSHWFLRPDDFPIIDRVVELAKQKDFSPAQIALAWLLSKKPIVVPIVGATDLKHLEEAVRTTELSLSENDVKYLEELYKPRELTGHYTGEPMAGDPK